MKTLILRDDFWASYKAPGGFQICRVIRVWTSLTIAHFGETRAPRLQVKGQLHICSQMYIYPSKIQVLDHKEIR